MDQNDPNAWAQEAPAETVESTPAEPAARPNRTKKWLVAGVAAACLVSGGVGFGIGTATNGGDNDFGNHGFAGPGGQDATGQLPNGMGPGQGVDPDGDDWTGGHRRGPGGHGPGAPGQGVDPDGDNWTGTNEVPDASASATPTQPTT